MGRRGLAVVLVLAGAVLASGVAAGTGVVDLDGDGVPALAEVGDGTDPFDGDTDDDGVGDDAERDRGTDPMATDTDGDGLDDGEEVDAVETDPTVADTDGDGLDDGAERQTHGTDPTVADTDGDGVADGTEVTELGTDPTVADTDGDGLDDGEETQRYGTDPTVVDTDGEGLDDAAEVREHDTDPTSADSDGDGLVDAREVRALPTAPTDADSDGDRLDDGREIDVQGTDPVDGDTDDDGLGDGVEAVDRGPLADADPLHRDVFVELDYMRGERPDPDAIALVVEEFAEAPLENPDGSTGIALHVVVDDELSVERRTTPLDSVRLRATHFDNEGRGYHHAMVVADARRDGESIAGFAGTGHVVVQTSGARSEYTTRGQAHLLMHELGHSLGLSPTLYAGIDSYAVAYGDYESVMNYNSPWESLGYSDGGEFDDWAYLDANLFGPPVLGWRVPTPPTENATASLAVSGSSWGPSVALGPRADDTFSSAAPEPVTQTMGGYGGR